MTDGTIRLINFISIISLFHQLNDTYHDYELCVQMCCYFEDMLLAAVRQSSHPVLSSTLQQLQQSHDTTGKLDEIICKLVKLESEMAMQKREENRIKRTLSGIYVIKNRAWSFGSSDGENGLENKTKNSSTFDDPPDATVEASTEESATSVQDKIVSIKGFAQNKLSSLRSKVRQKLSAQADDVNSVKSEEDDDCQLDAEDGDSWSAEVALSNEESDVFKMADEDDADNEVVELEVMLRRKSRESMMSQEQQGSVSSESLSLSSCEMLPLTTADKFQGDCQCQFQCYNDYENILNIILYNFIVYTFVNILSSVVCCCFTAHSLLNC